MNFYLPWVVERYQFSLSEAAADLYANQWTTLWHIILPTVKPGIIAGCILVFVPSLGAFLAPDLLGGAKTFMIGSLIEEGIHNEDKHQTQVDRFKTLFRLLTAYLLVCVLTVRPAYYCHDLLLQRQ